MPEELLPNLNPATAGLYAATKAKLEFSEKRATEEAKEAKGLTNANYQYNRGANLRAEPLKLRSSLNAANTAGLAESGTLARNQGQIQTDFASKQARLGELRRSAINKINTGLARKDVELGLEGQANIANANAGQINWLKENPPAPTAAVGGAEAPNSNGWVQVPGGAYRNKGLVTPWIQTKGGAYRTSAARKAVG